MIHRGKDKEHHEHLNRNEAIRKAVSQARKELGLNPSSSADSFGYNSNMPLENKLPDEVPIHEITKSNLLDYRNEQLCRTNLSVEISGNVSVASSFCFQRYDKSECCMLSVKPNSTWQEIVTAVSCEVGLVNNNSITHFVLVDSQGDPQSAMIRSDHNFFKFCSSYEPGMTFLVYYDHQVEEVATKHILEAEYLSLAVKIFVRLTSSSESEICYICPRETWDQMMKIMSTSLRVSPNWIRHIIVEDQFNEELSPQISTAEKFWKFYSNHSQNFASYTVVAHLDETLVHHEKKRIELETSSLRIKVLLEALTIGEQSFPAISTVAFIQKNSDWNSIKLSISEYIGHPSDWIESFIMQDIENDDVSPLINNDVMFWKVFSTYDFDNGMKFLLIINEAAILESQRRIKEQHFRSESARLTVQFGNIEEISDVFEVYIPRKSEWSTITKILIDSMHIQSSDYIDFLVLTDSDYSPLSPSINTSSKFWKMEEKYGRSDSLLRVFLTEEGVQALRNRFFEDNSTSFTVVKSNDRNVSATVKFLPTYSWHQICVAIAETLRYESFEVVSDLIQVDSDGDSISPSIKSKEKFWRFFSKYYQNSVFLVNEDEDVKNKINLAKMEKQEEMYKSAVGVYFALNDAKEHNPVKLYLQPDCPWPEVLQAIEKENVLHGDSVSHVILKDAAGTELSVAINSSKLFWKFARNYNQHNNSYFCVYGNDTYVDSVNRKRAEDVKTHCPIRVTVRNESEVISLPYKCSWSLLEQTLCSQFPSLLQPTWIKYLLLCDSDGEVLSRALESSEQFWSIFPVYKYDDMVFTVEVDNEKVCKYKELLVEEEYKKNSKAIRLYLPSLNSPPEVAYIPFNCSFEDIKNIVASAFKLESYKWVSFFILKDSEGERLSVDLNSAVLFWKSANATKVEDSTYFEIVLDESEILDSRRMQEYETFMKAAVHIPMISSFDNSCQTVHCLPDADWDDLEVAILKVFHNSGNGVLDLILVDSDKVELSPKIDKSSTFWKVFRNSFTSEFYFLVNFGENNRVAGQNKSSLSNDLLRACSNGDLAAAKSCLDRGANVKVTNENLSSAMHFACLSGNFDLVTLLGDHGCPLDGCNRNGTTPFDCACISGNIDICIWLKNKLRLQLSDAGYGATAIHHACLNDHLILVEWLLKNGCSVSIPSDDGTYLIIEASASGNAKLVNCLLTAGADVHVSDQKGATPLIIACRSGFDDIVKLLLNFHSDVFRKDIEGLTAFQYCCHFGHLSSARALYAIASNVISTTDSSENTPLHLAAINGHIHLCKWLVNTCKSDRNARNASCKTAAQVAAENNHADLAHWLNEDPKSLGVQELDDAIYSNEFDRAKIILEAITNNSDNLELPHGTTTLHYAAACGYIDLAQYLIISGTDVNTPTDVGRAPIHYAAFKGHLEMVRYLYGVGANPNVKDNFGFDAYSIALKNGFTDIAEWIVSITAPNDTYISMPASSLFSCVPVNQSLEKQFHNFSVEQFDEKASKSLPMKQEFFDEDFLSACLNGNLDDVKYFVTKGSKINIGSLVPSPLHLATYSGNLRTVQYVCEAGANLNLLGNNSDESSVYDPILFMSPLHIACLKSSDEIAMYLIHKGADLHLKNQDGDSCLHIICSKGSYNLLTDICNLPRSILPILKLDVRSNHLLNLLHCAAASGNKVLLALLLEHNVEINAIDDERKIPLHYACMKGHYEAAVFLLSQGSHLDMQDFFLRTPLLFACSSGNLNLVKYLVDSGASLRSVSAKGNNCAHAASISGNVEVIRFLDENGLRLDITNVEGKTPLQLASECAEHGNEGCRDIVNYLSISNRRCPHTEEIEVTASSDFKGSESLL